VTATRTTTSDVLGAYEYWPEDPFWSFQFIRMVEQACVGAADFAELHMVAKDLPVGDGEAWYAGFKALAEKLEAKAATAADGGHLVSARDTWLRASNYYRSAGFFLSPADERHGEAVVARRRSFQAAGRLSPADIEPVEIPYEGTTIPGYRFGPVAGSPQPGPAAVIFGGTDAVAEEMYFFLGRALSERGFTAVAIDGPGQGEALRRGIHSRHDFEVPVGAAVDYLVARDDVDPQQVVLVGQSLGGYYAARAAAFETRLRASVIWGAVYSVHQGIAEHLAAGGPTADHFAEQFQRIVGVGSLDELMSRLEAYTLDGVAERIRMPTLIVHGEADLLSPIPAAYRLFEEISSETKDLIVYPTGQPGCTHCQVDALPLVHFDICNWLERQLRA